MATEDDAATPELEGETAASGAESPSASVGARVGEYTWDDFLREHGHEAAADALYERFDAAPGSDRWGEADATEELTAEDWERAGVDPADFLGFHPDELPHRFWGADAVGESLRELCAAQHPLDRTPVIKGYYAWEDYKKEYFYDEEGNPPTDEEGNEEPFDRGEALGFDPDRIENALAAGAQAAEETLELEDERTVDVNEELNEDAFFSTESGATTLTNRYDLERAVPMSKKSHFREIERYWVNKPYSFVIIFHSTKENEKKYYAVQPYLTEIEAELQDYLTGKLRTSIKYSDESVAGGDEEHRKRVISEETYSLLDRYDLYSRESDGGGFVTDLADRFGFEPTEGIAGRIAQSLGYAPPEEDDGEIRGIAARPEPAVLAEDAATLTEYQVEKLLYFLKRDFIGYERIDPIKYDINVEDISCDGYDSPVFVYHSDYEQIISNIYHDRDELDDFVVKLAQRSGKGISKRRPQVDATLPDGSRAQLTLGKEVSDHGTNYTIRQFKDVPFTPIDLINWKTFSLDEMAFLWLCIENHKSLIFAGGTASGKTTSLNAVSLFIPSNSKIVSIEDTREVELPQRNWIASVTRPSFSDDDKGDVDEFDLLEAALRQRPDYIVMGEIRGEEGRTAFQVMSTGHTTYTTFHADSVGEVLKRFTTEPINVSKTMFTALDLVSIQASTRVEGHKVRRNKSLTEINHYDAENDEINVQDVYQWQAETDEFLQMGDSNTLEEIKFDRGWTQEKLEDEMFQRQVVLAYLIDRGLNTYSQVAATFQAFINDPETILALMANEGLERSLEDLREMESVLIDVDPEKEEMVPRPKPDEEGREEARRILEEAEELFEQYRGEMPDSVADALLDVTPAADVEASVTEGERPALEEATDEAPSVEGADDEAPALDAPGEGTPDESASDENTSDENVSEDGEPAVDPSGSSGEDEETRDDGGLDDDVSGDDAVDAVDADDADADSGGSDPFDVDTGGIRFDASNGDDSPTVLGDDGPAVPDEPMILGDPETVDDGADGGDADGGDASGTEEVGIDPPEWDAGGADGDGEPDDDPAGPAASDDDDGGDGLAENGPDVHGDDEDLSDTDDEDETADDDEDDEAEIDEWGFGAVEDEED
ncbi:ATPase, T2SS/T4P/T4SS family [Haloparvum sedimenti]|uniref:ATPase, T2SS/T4P/T4SS family n=1 Tax=Haloparvum sedimenti TaxID=1678448 RepID=UPI0009B5BD88|nr:ATPase, T2SS/T4P/T4SS family [Haloparvum sedimenti]